MLLTYAEKSCEYWLYLNYGVDLCKVSKGETFPIPSASSIDKSGFKKDSVFFKTKLKRFKSILIRHEPKQGFISFEYY